jgi:hypothetical protein
MTTRRKPHLLHVTFTKPAGYVDTLTMTGAEATRRWPEHAEAIARVQRRGATEAHTAKDGSAIYFAQSAEREG